MIIFKWDSKLELGIRLIDEQHQQIIESANAFFISHKCGEILSKTNDCLQFLQQYVLYHFQAEEAFQVGCGYPGYREHQATHNYLKTQVQFHATKLVKSDFDKGLVDEFHDFIKQWIVGHILKDDIAFAQYYKESQVLTP